MNAITVTRLIKPVRLVSEPESSRTLSLIHCATLRSLPPLDTLSPIALGSVLVAAAAASGTCRRACRTDLTRVLWSSLLFSVRKPWLSQRRPFDMAPSPAVAAVASMHLTAYLRICARGAIRRCCYLVS